MRAVLERDFLSEASRPRAFVIRSLLAVLVALFAIAALWVATALLGTPLDRVGAGVFRTGGVALLAAVVLLTPPLVVGSVLEERLQETLPIVLAAPVGPRGFALAKLLARSGAVITIAFAAFPCLALASLFGGVGGREILGLAGLTLAVVLEIAAWSLWVSTVSRRFGTAVVFAYLLPLVRWVLTLMFARAAFLGRGYAYFLRSGPSPGGTFLADTTPLGAVANLLDYDPFDLARMGFAVRPGGTGPVSVLPWMTALLVASLLAILAVAASASRLRTESEPRAPSATIRTRRRRRLFRGLPGTGNPLVWKETRLLNTAGSRPLYYRVLVVMFLVELAGMVSFLQQGPGPALGYFAFHVALVTLIATVNGAATLGNDRFQGSYDLVRVSPLTPGEIFRGKAAGVLIGVGFLASIPACHLVIGVAVGAFHPLTACAGLLLLVAVPAAWMAVGLSHGIRFPSPGTAVFRATLLLVVLSLGLPLVGGLLGTYLAITDPRAPPWHVLLVDASPPLTVYHALCWVQQRLVPASWSSTQFIDNSAAGAAMGLGYLLFTGVQPFLLPWLLRRRLERERDTG